MSLTARIISAVGASVICVILIVAVLIPIISEETEGEGWTYDDYRVVDGATAAGGSLELVSVGGVEYVHAADVGPGTITYSDGRVEDVTVGKAVLDVYLMDGQSNAAYYVADPAQVDPVPKPGTGYYYGTATEPVHSFDFAEETNAFWSMTADDGTARIGDKGPVFAAHYYELTHRKVCYITAAIGNTGIGAYPPEGAMWVHTQAVVDAAMAAIDTSKFDVHTRGYMFIQGEYNSTNTGEYYYELYFLRFHDAVISGQLGYDFDCCFLSVPRQQNAIDPHAVQIRLADEHDDIVLASTAADSFTVENGLMGPDNLHYSQLGDNIIGRDLAQATAERYGMADNELGLTRDVLQVLPLIFVAVLIVSVGVAVMRMVR